MYPFKSTELFLDSYLLQKYKIGLRYACLKILFNSKIVYTFEGRFMVIPQDITLNKIANIISYGFDNHPGSMILKAAFTL